jgi:hypothetical protein
LAADIGEGPSLDHSEQDRSASISFYGVASPESSITGRHDGEATCNRGNGGCPALDFETFLITAAPASGENDGEYKVIDHDAHPDHGMGPARVMGTSPTMLGHGHRDIDPYDADDEGLDSGGEDDDDTDELNSTPSNILIDDGPLSSPFPNPATPTTPSTLAHPTSESDHASLRAWFDLPAHPYATTDTDTDSDHSLTYYTDTTTGYDSLPDNSDVDADINANITDEAWRHLAASELAAVIWLVEQELEGLGEGVWGGLMGIDTDGEGEDRQGGGGDGEGCDTGSEGGRGSGSGSGSEDEGEDGGDGNGDGVEGGGERARVGGSVEGWGCDWCLGLGPEW